MKMHEKQLTDKMMYLYMYCSNEDAVWFRFFNFITEFNIFHERLKRISRLEYSSFHTIMLVTGPILI